jgi:hypothetical protein
MGINIVLPPNYPEELPKFEIRETYMIKSETIQLLNNLFGSLISQKTEILEKVLLGVAAIVREEFDSSDAEAFKALTHKEAS